MSLQRKNESKKYSKIEVIHIVSKFQCGTKGPTFQKLVDWAKFAQNVMKKDQHANTYFIETVSKAILCYFNLQNRTQL